MKALLGGTGRGRMAHWLENDNSLINLNPSINFIKKGKNLM
jgi:hypothetical protein